MSKKLPLTLLLICLASATGCVGVDLDAPSKQTVPVTFDANNSADSTYTFEVFVVNRSTNLSVRESDGKSYSEPIGGGLVSTEPSEGHHFTEVTPDSGRHYRNFTLHSNESVESEISNLPVSFVILVIVYDDESKVVEYVTATCGDQDLVALGVTSYSDGVTPEYLCG